MQLRESDSEYAELQRSLLEEKELRKSADKACESLRSDIETTRKATVDIRNRLKRSAVEEQLNVVEAKLLKVKERNQQLTD
ncbi:hypothetical protein AXG93_203s1270 [Marchantia polymorpha subsp. ruderalis]|uniref:Uncharacterized protein n=1 Tax=Marchantia polymorpha subsp. ruderalis TaxID=1480154 RepID=A0A176VKC5_MARPO|nr:hypothetical protein AXG93_203s1270 [Marchantia polymorpha subsp. ruderalis]